MEGRMEGKDGRLKTRRVACDKNMKTPKSRELDGLQKIHPCTWKINAEEGKMGLQKIRGNLNK